MQAVSHNEFPPLLNPSEIARRIEELAGEIVSTLGTEPITVVSLLKGAFIFTADLIRALSKLGIASQVEFIVASSYGAGTYSNGEVNIQWLGEIPLAGKRILLVDDILDTGFTISKVRDQILKDNPGFCKIAVLLDKPSRRVVPVTADFVGFAIDDYFVVGYGLDFAEQHRSLPFVAILPPEARGTGQ